jgi:hypothetical protein
VLKAQEHVWRMVETMVGPVELERPYFYRRACRAGLYSLDDALGLVAGCKQLNMHKAAVNLVTEVPYDTAQSLFHDLMGVPFGSERMPTVAKQVAEGLTVLDVAPSREEIERRIASASIGRFRRPVIVLGIDGAYVPTRQGMVDLNQSRQITAEASAEKAGDTPDDVSRHLDELQGIVNSPLATKCSQEKSKLGGETHPHPLTPVLTPFGAFPVRAGLLHMFASNEAPHLIVLHLRDGQVPQQGRIDLVGFLRRSSEPKPG